MSAFGIVLTLSGLFISEKKLSSKKAKKKYESNKIKLIIKDYQVLIGEPGDFKVFQSSKKSLNS